MQQNQNGKISIFENQKVREELAWALCSKINELAGLEGDKAYKKEDVLAWCNDSKKLATCKKGFIARKSRDAYNKVEDELPNKITNTYGYDLELSTSNRAAYFLYDISGTEEAKEKNAELNCRMRNRDANNKLSNDLVNKIVNIDPNLFAANNEEEAIEIYSNNIPDMELAFNSAYLASYIRKSGNQELAEIYDHKKAVLEGGTTFTLFNYFSNPLAMLIPPNKDFEPSMLVAFAPMLDEVRRSIVPDAKTDEMVAMGSGNVFACDFSNLGSMMMDKSLMEKNKPLIKQFQEKGWLDKDFVTKKKLMLGDKEVSTTELVTMMDRSGVYTLPTDLKIVDRDPKELEKINENNKAIDEKARIVEEKRVEINKYNKKVMDQSKADMKLNYASLSQIANDAMKGISVRSSADLGKKASELANSQLGQNDRIQELLNKSKNKLSEDDIIKSMTVIADINAKSKEYQKKSRIAKWWYRKSYTQMLNTRDKLIKSLGNHGIDTKNFDELTNDAKVISSISKGVKEQDNFFKKVDEDIENIYDQYLGKPNKEIEEVKNELIQAKVDRVKTEQRYREYRIDVFNKSIEGMEEAKNISYEDFNKMPKSDKNFKIINDAIKAYRFKNPDMVTEYNKLKTEKSEAILKCDKLDAEIKARSKSRDKGEQFDKGKFEADYKDSLARAVEERSKVINEKEVQFSQPVKRNNDPSKTMSGPNMGGRGK